LAGIVLAASPFVLAHSGEPLPAPQPQPGATTRSTSEWLLRMYQASRRRAYIGTLVVNTDGQMASSRIWHVCDGERQIERVESLSGTPRSTFRHNDQVITFSPQSKTAVRERRDSLGLFPHLLGASNAAVEQFYAARPIGVERVAGLEADVVTLQASDRYRFSYRVWSERRTGLVIKLQTLHPEGRVMEEVAFSELQLDAPVSMSKLTQMMSDTSGYTVQSPELEKTSAQAQGWRLKSPVSGFQAVSCYLRPRGAEARAGAATLQWVYSDGLATVSIFIETYDHRRHVQDGLATMGATHTLAQRRQEPSGDWWLTIVGEVPVQTLEAFARGLERIN
jgi:sigma-E factor negative regulatory protein RseB